MDRIDRRILRELQANGRLTNQELAERVNLSPSPCLRRVRLLEEAGVILGYTAIVDQEKLGLPVNAFVSVRLERPSPEAMRTFEERIQRHDDIQECYLMTGSRDYLLHVVSHSLKTYEQFVREQLTQIPGIASVETSFAFGRVKRINRYPAVDEAD
jgi:Lrp/AsnC family leucine-responsive transcriptional regulator